MATTRATQVLDHLGIEYHVLVHAQPVYTAEDAAAQRGVALSRANIHLFMKIPARYRFVTLDEGAWLPEQATIQVQEKQSNEKQSCTYR